MFQSHKIKLGETNIHYVEAGPQITSETKHSARSIIFLHGFPEYWGTWHQQIKHFSKHYQVIAPDLPGYNLSDKPKALDFYRLPNLIQFVADLIQALAPNEKVLLVAHDWGGAIAWPLAAFHPQLIDKLVIINAAHPSTFTREMINNSQQRKQSEYIHQLIAPDAEQKLAANDFEYLQDKLFASMQTNSLSESQRKAYVQVWEQPGAISGMLQYYRAMPQLADSEAQPSKASGPVTSIDKMKVPNIRIEVDTLVLWGENDQAFVLENLDDLAQYVPNLRVKRFADASHWLHHEWPKRVNNFIADFFLDLNN
ncbi:alpha/beta fold hydrolase [Paraglaciecola aestuariivivens]